MTFRILGAALLLAGLIAVPRPATATEPGSKECSQYSAANHCSAVWDRRDKACTCHG